MEDQPDLRLIIGQGETPDIEAAKTERVLRVVRGVDFAYMSGITHIPGNPFYKDETPPDDAA